MSGEIYSWLFLAVAGTLFTFLPQLDKVDVRKALGMVLFFELFYLIGHYLAPQDWPFPTPFVLLQLVAVTGLGYAVGAAFSKYWPLPQKVGFERIIRTFILGAPALGLGIGLQLLMQGNTPTQSLYLVFALSAWLASGKIKAQAEEGTPAKEVPPGAKG